MQDSYPGVAALKDRRGRTLRTFLFGAAFGLMFLALANRAMAEINEGAVRFFGSGSAATPNRDRVNIQIDDNVAGAASTAADVGAGSFTVEFWIRGSASANDAPLGSWNAGASNAGIAWTEGNVVVDRDIYTTTSQAGDHRDWGISLLGGRVAFGTGFGQGPSPDTEATLIGNRTVVTAGGDSWFHIALVRDAATGFKSIYINGELDVSSNVHPSNDDLSYPDQGLINNYSAFNPFLVIGAEKHDFPGSRYYSGYFDELRLWNIARTGAQISSDFQMVLAAGTPGLAGYWRFEEPGGTMIANEVSGSPSGQLINNSFGNGLRVYSSDDPANTPLLFIPEPSSALAFCAAAIALLSLPRHRRRA